MNASDFDPSDMHLTAKRILVTGRAGFLGSHLCTNLLDKGHEVLCSDNFFTGRRGNLHHLLNNQRFEVMLHDVTSPLYVEVDETYNLACPASPFHYQLDPVQTTKTGVHGEINMLGLAKHVGAAILQPSTSEVYGDPQIHPQTEDCMGDASQIRSFCIVSDLIYRLIRLMESPKDVTGPINLGNLVKLSIRELAETVIRMTGSESQLDVRPLPQDDPIQRQPDITRAKNQLDWAPRASLEQGLEPTIAYFKRIFTAATKYAAQPQ